MNILVINCGSSSIKFTLFDYRDLSVIASGLVDRIGHPAADFRFKTPGGVDFYRQATIDRIQDAVALIADPPNIPGCDHIQRPQIAAIGHRVVHGGETMNQPTRIDSRVKDVIRSCFDLAPLHNPPNLEGIEACERRFPGTRQVAVFDTAFHATLAPTAFLYALPHELYRKHKIRRYGFHGTSHQYVSRMAARKMGKPIISLRLITCHLGNGSSITAVDGGKSIDTSMGFTPLEGVPMGTRCGDLDPAIVFHLMRRTSMTADQVETLLVRESGLKGLGGIGAGDMRDLEMAAAEGNSQAETAIQVFAYRVKKYIGSYAFAMGGVDAVAFTGGMGENSAYVRERICAGLEDMGISIDSRRNASPSAHDGEIHASNSRVRLLVIPTNEELEIARQTVHVLQAKTAGARPDSPNTKI